LIRVLDLFSGAGGAALAAKLLGWTTVGYVEIDDYCQRVIAQRIRDGLLDDAPIFGDIRAFIREGYAASYQGMADVVTAGFPCQPFSLAGRRLGDADERDMWPATMGCIRVVRPRFCLLENSPGLLIRGMGRVLGDLAESGYDATYDCIPAAAVGAPHFRDRVFIFATSAQIHNAGSDVTRHNKGHKKAEGRGMPHFGIRPSGAWGAWASEPGVARVAYGVSNRVDRKRATGQGQVPAVAAAAWWLLGGE
jgi:DNA (cytosine-5)-methyltransferase 1